MPNTISTSDKKNPMGLPQVRDPSRASLDTKRELAMAKTRFPVLVRDFNEKFGVEGLLMIKELFIGKKFKAEEFPEKLFSGDERLAFGISFLDHLNTSLEYFLGLEKEEFLPLVDALQLSKPWPVEPTGRLKAKRYIISMAIRNDMLQELLEAIEHTVVRLELPDRLKEEKQEHELTYKMSILQSIKDPSVEYFMSALPADMLYPYVTLTGLTPAGSRRAKQLPGEVLNMTYSAIFVKKLMDICWDIYKLYEVQKKEKPKRAALLPKRYRQLSALCTGHKVIDGYWKENFTDEEFAKMKDAVHISVREISDKKAVLKHEPTDTTVTVFKDHVERGIRRLEQERSRLVIGMGIVIQEVAKQLEKTL